MVNMALVEEDERFWKALASADNRLVQVIPGAANAGVGCLDVTVIHGVLLVVWGAGGDVVVARGTDLATMALIDFGGCGEEVRAVAFREEDGGLAVGGADAKVVVYRGWKDGRKVHGGKVRKGELWNEIEFCVGTQELGLRKVEMVSWSRNGRRLAIVGDGVIVYEVSDWGYSKIFSLTDDEVEEDEADVLFGKISPDGGLIVAAKRYCQFGWVYQIPEKIERAEKEMEGGDRRIAALSFGRSGVTSLDWKPRGGGLPALLSTDSDGTLRLWARILPHTSPSGTFMEEVARSPHVPTSAHASAAFLHWGGGGGVGDDEADAVAAALSHGFVDFPMAPKPSRCHQWVMCYAAGDAVAWRVRGLDDRPRAQYTRLEPACGKFPHEENGEEPLNGMPADNSSRWKRSFKELSGTVFATKAVSAIPLPTSSPKVVEMVKSYAISNGERRLRCPEPPEAPRHTTLFTLSSEGIQDVQVMRYDTCPTTRDQSLIRCRSLPGHSMGIKLFSAATMILVSTGMGGDVIVWRVDPSATSTRPLRPLTRLKGCYSAAVAINSTSVAAVDAKTNKMKIVRIGKNTKITTVEGVSPCISQGRVASILSVKLERQQDSCYVDVQPINEAHLRQTRARVFMCTSEDGHSFSTHILDYAGRPRECITQVKGRRFGKVTAATCYENIVAIGSGDGCIRLYRMALTETNTWSGGDQDSTQVVLEEINFLGESDGSDAEIVALSIDESHVAAAKEDGSFVVWSYKENGGCHLELSVSDDDTDVFSRRIALETDVNNEKRLYVSEGATLSVYLQQSNGKWTFCSASELGAKRGRSMSSSLKDGNRKIGQVACLANGIIAVSFDTSIAILNLRPAQTKSPGGRTWRVDELLAIALLGQGADVIIGALEELATIVDSAASQTLKPSYRAKGLPLPPPSLSILTSGKPSTIYNENGSSQSKREQENKTRSAHGLMWDDTIGMSLTRKGGRKRNLFLELMKRTEDTTDSSQVSGDNLLTETDELMRLKVRLRTVSIEGVDQFQKYSLGCLADACSSLKSVLASLDRPGRVFALFGQLHIAAGDHTPLSDAVVACAMHSSAADALAEHFLMKNVPSEHDTEAKQSLWDTAKLLGAGFWIQSLQAAKGLAGRIARLSFASTRDADSCAIWYIALGRVSALASLYLSQQNIRMGKFLKRDFSEVPNQEAAAKNAYVLVSKHRLHLAASFFILAGDVRGALNLVRARLHDEQLAILLARVIRSGDYLAEVLGDVGARARDSNDVHRLSIVQWLSGSHAESLSTLYDAGHGGTVQEKKQTEKSGLRETRRGLGAKLPKSTYIAGHILVLSNRPPLRGTRTCAEAVSRSRERAINDLVSAEYYLAALCILLNDFENEQARFGTRRLQSLVSTILSMRSISHANASRVGTGGNGLADAMKADLNVLRRAKGNIPGIVQSAVRTAVSRLAEDDEADAAVALAVIGKAMEELREAIQVTSARAVSRTLCALSRLHRPDASSNDLDLLVTKMKTAVQVALDSVPRDVMIDYYKTVRELKKAAVGVNFGIAFLRGNWSYLLQTLRSCEGSPSPVLEVDVENGAVSDNIKEGSLVSLESLRYIASNPAVHDIFHDATQRRVVKAPSMSLVEFDAGVSSSLNAGAGDASVCTNVSTTSLLRHPLLSSALGSVVVAYLSTHLASSAAEVEPFYQRCLSGCFESIHELSDKSRLLLAAEELEHVAADATSGWIPLVLFGSQQSRLYEMKTTSSTAFLELWGTLGCLPEYARTLSDAATVAAAETASTAVELLSPRQARKQFDTASADYLFGAYPIRFSTLAKSPWSGLGRHTGLYREKGALFRTLCLSASDPPAIIVATPRGIQEIVPASYTTVPSGFRTHYGIPRGGGGSIRSLTSLEENSSDYEAVYSILDHEIEPPPEYTPLNMKSSESPNGSTRGGSAGKHATMRHEVEATALAAHPFKPRFATGGTDGAVRIWEYGGPISRVSLHLAKFGRVSSVSFSAYGSALLAVYASGNLALWSGSHINRRSFSAKSSRNAKIINAFNSRRASDGTFLDEGRVVAAVGDPSAPPAVGHSLRVFDTREPNVEFHPSMSIRVHEGGEATCLALLDDRVRVVTGGEDGSLCIVDLRNRPCVVSRLPAHNDEVTCLSLEVPRGRALASGCRTGDIKVWDARTLLQLDHIQSAHEPTRHYWSGSGIGGLVGIHGVQSVALTDRSLISCGGDGIVKIWGPGWGDYDLKIV